MKVWVVTEHYNDYNQQDGGYFVAVYSSKPSAETLADDLEISLKAAEMLYTTGTNASTGIGYYVSSWYSMKEVACRNTTPTQKPQS